MIIEFELLGSKELHKGIFDTHGFWVKHLPHGENLEAGSIPEGWKLFSHISFCYYHEDKEKVDLVYNKLISVLRGANNVEIEGIGYFRKVNK
jgi:hypothetical protein